MAVDTVDTSSGGLDRNCKCCGKEKTKRYRVANPFEGKSELLWFCEICARAIKWVQDHYKNYRPSISDEPIDILPIESRDGIGVPSKK